MLQHAAMTRSRYEAGTLSVEAGIAANCPDPWQRCD